LGFNGIGINFHIMKPTQMLLNLLNAMLFGAFVRNWYSYMWNNNEQCKKSCWILMATNTPKAISPSDFIIFRKNYIGWGQRIFDSLG
jgi:hypothetical protein